MAYMGRTLLTLLLILLSLKNLLYAEEPSQPVSVGFIVGLSGPLVGASDQMRRGVEIALAEPEMFPLTVVYEDDHGFDNKEAVKAFQRILSRRDVPLILNWGNSTMPAIAPFANRRRIPLIAVWDSNSGISALGPYMFAAGTSTELAAANIADLIVSKRDLKKLALLSVNDPWSELVRGAFKEKFNSLGGELVSDDVANPSDQDFRTLLLRAKEKGAQGVFAPIFFDSLHALIRQAKELGFADNIYTGNAFVESDVAQLGKLADGVYSSQAVIRDPRFIEKYRRRFGDASKVGMGVAALSYDAIQIVSLAMKKVTESGKKISGETLQPVLASMRHEGITGTVELGGKSLKAEEVVIARDGKFQTD